MRQIGEALGDVAEGEAAFASQAIAVTQFPDPTPLVRQIEKRLVTYTREDGVALSFTLYTPPGYQEGTRVPAILYAYPMDYADPRTGRAGARFRTDLHPPVELPPAAAGRLRDHRQRRVPDRR